MINSRSFQLFAGSTTRYSTRAIDLVNQSTVIDMLGLVTLDFHKLYAWQEAPETFQKADFEKLKNSGITVFHPAVGFDQGDTYKATLQDIERWTNLIRKQGDYFMRVVGPDDIRQAKSLGKIGILLGQQNSEHFRSVDDVDRFYDLGQRVSQLTYRTNRIGGGAPYPQDAGLTPFGASIVERMNKVGMAIDVSHCGDRTTLDTFAASRKPVLITHSNCRSLVPNRPRCKTDEAIWKMALTGGVMGVTMIRGFVKPAGPATVDALLDHIDRIVRLVGVEHVGIGSDVDLDGHSRLTPETLRAEHILGGKGTDLDGINYLMKMYDVTEGLIRRGYSDDDIKLILGGNFQRALSEIWAA